jgi:hypothetical protein
MGADAVDAYCGQRSVELLDSASVQSLCPSVLSDEAPIGQVPANAANAAMRPRRPWRSPSERR